MRIHQLIAAAAPGDAVTDQALAWQGILRGWGAEGLVIAEHVHPALEGAARRVDRSASELRRADGLVLHYSVWSRVVDDALAAPAPLAVCYHNVTPGDLLRPWNPALADACDRGRAALPRLAGRAAALIADSAFNAARAGRGRARGGARRAAPARPARRGARRAARRARRPRSSRWAGSCPTSASRTCCARSPSTADRHAPDATLTLVGSDEGFASYRAALEDLGARIGREGCASPAGCRAPSATASTTPRTPTCACPSTRASAPRWSRRSPTGCPWWRARRRAVPETLGGAGVVVAPPDLLPLAAEALAEVVGSPATRAGPRGGGRRGGWPSCAAEAVVPSLRAALAPLLGAA